MPSGWRTRGFSAVKWRRSRSQSLTPSFGEAFRLILAKSLFRKCRRERFSQPSVLGSWQQFRSMKLRLLFGPLKLSQTQLVFAPKIDDLFNESKLKNFSSAAQPSERVCALVCGRNSLNNKNRNLSADAPRSTRGSFNRAFFTHNGNFL